MGPRRFRRGNRGRSPEGRVAERASMGPRRFRRGNIAHAKRLHKHILASMGPRRFRRGNALNEIDEMGDVTRLQWGRDVSAAEIGTALERP